MSGKGRLLLQPKDWELVVNATVDGDRLVARPGWQYVEALSSTWPFLSEHAILAAQGWSDGRNYHFTVLLGFDDGDIKIIDLDMTSGEVLTNVSLLGDPDLISYVPGDRWDACAFEERCFFSRRGVTIVVGPEVGGLYAHVRSLPLCRYWGTAPVPLAASDFIEAGMKDYGRVKFAATDAAWIAPMVVGSFGGEILASHQGRIFWAGFHDEDLVTFAQDWPTMQDIIPEEYLIKRDVMRLGSMFLWWSEPDNPFAISGRNFLMLPENPITALAHFGDRLMIFTPQSTWALVGDGMEQWTLRKVATGIGCIARDSVQATPQGLVWLGGDDIYLYDGQSIRGLLPPHLKRLVFEGRQPFVPKSYLDGAMLGGPAQDLVARAGYPWVAAELERAIAGVDARTGTLWLGFWNGLTAHNHYAMTSTTYKSTGASLMLSWHWASGQWAIQGTRAGRGTDWVRTPGRWLPHAFVNNEDGLLYSVGPGGAQVLSVESWADEDTLLFSVPVVLAVSRPFGTNEIEEGFWQRLHVFADSAMGTDSTLRVWVIPDQASFDTQADDDSTEEVGQDADQTPRPTADYILEGGNTWGGGWYPVRRDTFHDAIAMGRISRSIRIAVALEPDAARIELPELAMAFDLEAEEGLR